MTAIVWLLSVAPLAASPDGVGPYLFGMTPEQVQAVEACTPYKPVRRTGGLECANYSFEGTRMNISFFFDKRGLQTIQLWFYEGTDRNKALRATEGVLEHVQRNFGAVVSRAVDDGQAVTAESLVQATEAVLGREETGRISLFPVQQPPGRWIYGRMGYIATIKTYLVFLFYSLPPQ